MYEKICQEKEALEKTVAEISTALEEKDAALEEKDATIAEISTALVEKDAALEEKDALIAELKSKLAGHTITPKNM